MDDSVCIDKQFVQTDLFSGGIFDNSKPAPRTMSNSALPHYQGMCCLCEGFRITRSKPDRAASYSHGINQVLTEMVESLLRAYRKKLLPGEASRGIIFLRLFVQAEETLFQEFDSSFIGRTGFEPHYFLLKYTSLFH